MPERTKTYARKYDYDDNGTPMYAIILWGFEWLIIRDSRTPDKEERDVLFSEITKYTKFQLIGPAITQEHPPNELTDTRMFYGYEFVKNGNFVPTTS